MESYRVIYEIDVDAENHLDAALQVEKIMRNPEYRPFLEVKRNQRPSDSQNIDLEMEEVEE